MPRMHKHGTRETRLIERLNRRTVKTDALISLQHGFMLAPVTPSNAPVSLTNGNWNVCDLITACLSRVCRSTQGIKSFQEKGADEVGLEPSRFGLLHLLFNRKETLRAHGFLSKSIAIQQDPQMLAIKRLVDLARQTSANLRLISVENCLQQ